MVHNTLATQRQRMAEQLPMGPWVLFYDAFEDAPEHRSDDSTGARTMCDAGRELHLYA